MEEQDSSNNDDRLEKGETIFNSEDIGKKEKIDYFVRVEGAEERKKEAIRKMQKRKDELIRKQKAEELAKQREARKERFQAAHIKRKERIESFWHRSKKILLAVLILLVIAGAGFGIYRLLNPPLPENVVIARESIDRSSKQTFSFYDELGEQSANYATREELYEWAENRIAELDNNHDKFDYYSMLSGNAATDQNYLDYALKYALKLEELAQDDGEKIMAYETISTVYFEMEDFEKYNEYQQKLEQYKGTIDRMKEEYGK